MHNLDREQKLELLRLLEEKARRSHLYRYRTYFDTRYEWQKKFISLSSKYSQVALIAANRVGKTDTATYIDAIHAIGDYPDGWGGYKFDHAPLIWCLGYSGEKIRDLLQTPLLGRKTDDGWEGGLIPGDLIVDTEPMTGTPNAVRSAYIRHKSGRLSKIQFWSYSQGQHALMGDSVDWFHIDEEPKDETIYPQVLTRTATGDKGRGGRGILTFTPENGRTELVIGFMDNPSAAQTCMNVGWDEDLLRMELSDLINADFDVSLTGFSPTEIDELLTDVLPGTENEEEPYTTKIDTPVYEPSGGKPDISELYDDTKTQELISRIRSASLEPDIEKFLLCAAERHTVFNFSRIADYYAHAPAEIQCFFEESALVIIDYQQAIENGFVRMTQRMVEIMHGGEEEEYA